jgi:hypothetical protein
LIGLSHKPKIALTRYKYAARPLKRGLRTSLGNCTFQAGAFYRMSELGKGLVILGLVIAAVGLLLWSGFGKGWLGRLPGDIHYTRGNFSFYAPIVTCLLASLLLTLILWLFRK